MTYESPAIVVVGEVNGAGSLATALGARVVTVAHDVERLASVLGDAGALAIIIVAQTDASTLRLLELATGRAPVVLITRDVTADSLSRWLARGADAVACDSLPATLLAAVANARAAAQSRGVLAALENALPLGAVVTDAGGTKLFEAVWGRSRGLCAAETNDQDEGSRSSLLPAGTSVVTDAAGVERTVRTSSASTHTAVGFLSSLIQEDQSARMELERKLIAAQRSETVSQLSRGVVHDLNNAFSIIQSFADLLCQETPEEDPRRADLEEIHRAAIRAAAMTRGLTTFQKRAIGQPESLDTSELLRRLEPLARRMLGERTELALKGSGREEAAAITAFCDPALFEQAVLEALTILQPAAQDRLLTVSVESLDKHVAVKIVGAGAPLELERVHGLRELMSFAGGEIHRVLGAGNGSAEPFVAGLELRFAKSTRQLHRARSLITASSTPETILIVEDERPVRVAMSRVLGSLGYRVLEARRSADARNVAKSDHIDLIVSDVVLPDGDGVALLADLLESSATSRGLLVTGYDRSELGARVRDLPVLMKPFTTQELAAKVRQTLDGGLHGAL